VDERHGLSDGLLEQLNSLGFAVIGETGAGSGVTLTRLALGYHLRLTLEPTGADRWLVGLGMRASSVAMGRLPEATLPFALGRFGASPDGVRLEISRGDLASELPRLLEDAIIPVVDSALPRDG
jgi:hypothetical protein